MTPSPTTADMSYEDFEAEVRAMLTRRAADVSPSSAPRRRPAEEAADRDTPHVVSLTERRRRQPELTSPEPGEPPLVIPLSASRSGSRQARHRSRLAAAAAVVLVVGLVGYVSAAPGGDTVETEGPPAASGEPLVLWPHGNAVPSDQLADPASATRAYLHAVAGLPVDVILGDVTADGAGASVDYSLDEGAASVALLLVDGAWGVTGATSDTIAVDHAWLDGDAVDVAMATRLPQWPDLTVRATVVGPDGDTLATRITTIVGLGDGAGAEVDVDGEGDVRTSVVDPGDPVSGTSSRGADEAVLTPPGPSASVSTRIDLPAAEATDALAVRVDATTDDDGDPATPDVLVAHASQAITGPDDETVTTESTPDDPEADVASGDSATSPGDGDAPGGDAPSAPGIEELFPGALDIATTVDEAREYTDAHRGDPELTQWRTALTRWIYTAGSHDPVLSAPSPAFTDVVLRPDQLEVEGRYATPDGGTGTFHMARLATDGPWILISLRDDALPVTRVEAREDGLAVTLVPTKDVAQLGVGRVPLGWGERVTPPSRAFIEAGETATYALDDTQPGIALQFLLLVAVDGSELRFYESFTLEDITE